MEPDPLVQSDEFTKKAYNRITESTSNTDSKWFISKNAVISKLGLFGTNQESLDSSDNGAAAAPPKVKRKRMVRKKVGAS